MIYFLIYYLSIKRVWVCVCSFSVFPDIFPLCRQKLHIKRTQSHFCNLMINWGKRDVISQMILNSKLSSSRTLTSCDPLFLYVSLYVAGRRWCFSSIMYPLVLLLLLGARSSGKRDDQHTWASFRSPAVWGHRCYMWNITDCMKSITPPTCSLQKSFRIQIIIRIQNSNRTFITDI